MKRSVAQCFAITMAVAASGCGGGGEAEPAEQAVVENAGECGDAFGAQLCAWTRMQGETVMEVGATVPLASIENAPMDMPMAWPPEDLAVGLPAGSGELQHLTFGWNPMGHGPATYLTPHFDMHFYRIGNDQRTAIDCADESKPATLADAYGMIDEELPDDVAAMIGTKVLVGVCVPAMGMHSMTVADIERQTPFESTMIIGYYGTEPIFLEPMIAKETLLRRQSFDLPVPAVPGWTGQQPRAFRAEYVPDQDAYRFTFSQFSTAM